VYWQPSPERGRERITQGAAIAVQGVSDMGIGTQEILLLLFFALIFFGANKIPGIARGLGKGIAEFRRAARDIQDEINRSVSEEPERTGRRKEIPGGGPEQTAGGGEQGPPAHGESEEDAPSSAERTGTGEGEEGGDRPEKA